jgi:hypothetical protein
MLSSHLTSDHPVFIFELGFGPHLFKRARSRFSSSPSSLSSPRRLRAGSPPPPRPSPRRLRAVSPALLRAASPHLLSAASPRPRLSALPPRRRVAPPPRPCLRATAPPRHARASLPRPLLCAAASTPTSPSHPPRRQTPPPLSNPATSSPLPYIAAGTSLTTAGHLNRPSPPCSRVRRLQILSVVCSNPLPNTHIASKLAPELHPRPKFVAEFDIFAIDNPSP